MSVIVASGNTICICLGNVGSVRASLVKSVVNADGVGVGSDRFCLDPEYFLPTRASSLKSLLWFQGKGIEI